MNKTSRIICIDDYFNLDNIRLFTKGEIYNWIDNIAVIDNINERFDIVGGKECVLFKNHFREVELIRESEPLETVHPSHPNCTKESWDKAGKESQQQSEHYQKENDDDLETIEKMQIISDIFKEQGRTFTAMEGYTLLNQYKYLDRMGKKDDPKKEGYKICDYYERNKSEKWLHETSKKGDSTC